MSQCIFVNTGKRGKCNRRSEDMCDIYRCTECGFETPKEHLQRRCHKAPGIIQRAKNFGNALVGHIASESHGLASEDQIKERLDVCQDCPLYHRISDTRGVCTHKSCGCNLVDERTFLNKLAWKEQSCPDGRWGPIRDT